MHIIINAQPVEEKASFLASLAQLAYMESALPEYWKNNIICHFAGID